MKQKIFLNLLKKMLKLKNVRKVLKIVIIIELNLRLMKSLMRHKIYITMGIIQMLDQDIKRLKIYIHQ